MPAKTSRKRAPSARRATARGATRSRNGKRREEHENYKEGNIRLSEGLTETVCGMLLHAVAPRHSAKHQRELEESKRNTAAFKRFARKGAPPEVQRWVKENFMVGGDGFEAVESQVEIYVDELAVWMEEALRYHKGHWCLPFCDCTKPPGCP